MVAPGDQALLTTSERAGSLLGRRPRARADPPRGHRRPRLGARDASARYKPDTMAELVERADFVSIPVQDMERAETFYRHTLGMDSPDWAAGWPEIETGNVSLYRVDPTVMGMEFAPHTAHIAMRVPDVAAAQRAGGARRAVRRRARHRRVQDGVLSRQRGQLADAAPPLRPLNAEHDHRSSPPAHPLSALLHARPSGLAPCHVNFVGVSARLRPTPGSDRASHDRRRIGSAQWHA